MLKDYPTTDARFSVLVAKSVVDQLSRESRDKFIIEVLPSLLNFAASAGSLYRNMFVRPRSKIHPEMVNII